MELILQFFAQYIAFYFKQNQPIEPIYCDIQPFARQRDAKRVAAKANS
jgi:hypothetical protein